MIVVLIGTACSGGVNEPAAGPSAPAPPAPQPTPEPTPEAEPAPVEPPPPAGPTFTGRVATDLGPGTIDAVRNATVVEVGRMRVIGAMQAEAARFSSPNRILGYPVVGGLRSVDPARRDALVRVLFDDTSYLAIERRCANRDFVGARFTQGTTVVELALGRPCDQALFAFSTAAGPRTTGSIVTPEASQAIQQSLSP